MARKLRLEFPGACYHVINRGNYRADLFQTDKTKVAFEACLFEACAKSGWVLHAFVVMRNHYHLALETPQGNLVAGMQWLQATFANRFNKLRGERGHLFQGRYKALLVDTPGPRDFRAGGNRTGDRPEIRLMEGGTRGLPQGADPSLQSLAGRPARHRTAGLCQPSRLGRAARATAINRVATTDGEM